MSSFVLKLIAMLTMLIDHTGAVLFPQFPIFRMIGRLSFPIYCFLLAEGYRHTSSFPKYALRLFAFAFVSEIPYDLAFHGVWFFAENQNVFFTLLLGLLCMRSCDFLKKVHVLLILPAVAVFCAAAYFLRCDYTFYGILFMFGFYLFGTARVWGIFSFSLVNLFYALTRVSTQAYALFSAVPIALYNGKRGCASLKYLFYLFYPGHLLLLYFLQRFFL